MGSVPQPPRPPVPPPPPRTGTHIVAIALLVLALIIVVSGMAVWIGLKFLSRGVQVSVEEGRGGKEVSIRTPVGSLEVTQEVDEARLGLPIYPGATRLKGEDSATVKIDIADAQGVDVVAAKFETADPLAKVRDYYHQQLGKDVTKFVERAADGKTVFEIKKEGQEKIVALESARGKTVIALVRVTHGRPETN